MQTEKTKHEPDILLNGKAAIYLGDCLSLMQNIKSKSVDLVLTDPPYGTTQCSWDSVLNLENMWSNLDRILKPTGVIALTASQPFSSLLVASNLQMFKHEWIWIKNRGSNFANTVREPMKEHEVVLIFSKGKWTYNKQMQERSGGGLDLVGKEVNVGQKKREGLGKFKEFKVTNELLPKMRVPSSWQKFNTASGRVKTKHPTQKPVDLMEYMIKTYTNEGEAVLDFCMGSGTTGVAALRTKRLFLGIEINSEYFEIAKNRINNFNEE